MLLKKFTPKRRFVLCGAVLVLVGAVVTWLVIYINSPLFIEASYTLPTANVQKSLMDGNYKLYASNQNLSDLLFELDIYFKQQGFNSDGTSQDFKFDDSQSGAQKINTCVEFKYFNKGDEVARFTLMPDDPTCFTKDPAVAGVIKELRKNYTYIYVSELL